MPARDSRKKIAALCLAATLAGAGAASVAQAEDPANVEGGGLLAEIAVLWDSWKPWGTNHQERAATTGPEAGQSPSTPEVGPYYDPSG